MSAIWRVKCVLDRRANSKEVLHKVERFPPDLIAVSAFLVVAEVGSFTKASHRLGVAKSIISRRVSLLEEQLSAQLLVRSAKGAQLTEIGRTYFLTMVDLMGELEAAHEAAASSVTQIAGSIRLTAPVSFGISGDRRESW